MGAMGTTNTDADLLAASLQGDLGAFTVIVERYQRLVCGVSYSTTGNWTLAEDVAQDTFLAAWSDLTRLRDPKRLSSWLCGIARNLSSKALRRRRREVALESPEAHTERTALDDVVDRETRQLVWRSLERIPERYRETLILYYLEGRSAKGVAEALGVREATVHQRLSRGRKYLEAELSTVVESTLSRHRPKKGFAAAVIAAIAAGVTVDAAAAGGTTMLLTTKIGAVALLAGLVFTGWYVSETQPNAPSTVAARSAPPLAKNAATKPSAEDVAVAEAGANAVFGRTRKEDGTPVAGVEVCVRPLRPDPYEKGVWTPRSTTCVTSDATGHYAVHALHDGDELIVQGRLDRFVVEPTERMPMRAPNGEAVDLIVHDAVPSTVDIEDIGGGPIEGVSATRLLARPSCSATSDAHGVATLWCLPEAEITIRLQHPAYVDRMITSAVPGRVRAVLRPAASISGRIVSADDGAPAMKVRVGNDETMTTPTGAFTLEHIEPGSHAIIATGGDYFGRRVVSVEEAESKLDVQIPVERGQTVSIDIQSSGAPCAFGGARLKRETDATSFSSKADHLGRVALRGVPAGHYAVFARCGDRAVPVAPIDVADQSVTVTRSVPPSVALSGVVVDVTGRPIERARIIARDHHANRYATTDARGRFTVGVSSGSIVVEIDHAEYARHQRTVSVDGAAPEALRIALETGLRLVGHVVDAAGEPVAFASVRAWSSKLEEGHDVLADEDGGFELRGLPASIVRTADGYRFQLEEDITMAVGVAVATGDARSVVAGPDQNVDANTITLFETVPPASDWTVTNNERAAGGNVDEPDEDLRERCRQRFTATPGTAEGLRRGALEVQECREASIFQEPDSLGRKTGTVYAVVADAQGKSNSTLEALVLAELEANWAGAGIETIVTGATLTYVDIDVTPYWAVGYATSANNVSLRKAIVAAVSRLDANSAPDAASAPPESWLTHGLIQSVVPSIPGLLHLDVNDPTGTEKPGSGEIIRTTYARVTVTS